MIGIHFATDDSEAKIRIAVVVSYPSFSDPRDHQIMNAFGDLPLRIRYVASSSGF